MYLGIKLADGGTDRSDIDRLCDAKQHLTIHRLLAT